MKIGTIVFGLCLIINSIDASESEHKRSETRHSRTKTSHNQVNKLALAFALGTVRPIKSDQVLEISLFNENDRKKLALSLTETNMIAAFNNAKGFLLVAIGSKTFKVTPNKKIGTLECEELNIIPKWARIVTLVSDDHSTNYLQSEESESCEVKKEQDCQYNEDDYERELSQRIQNGERILPYYYLQTTIAERGVSSETALLPYHEKLACCIRIKPFIKMILKGEKVQKSTLTKGPFETPIPQWLIVSSAEPTTSCGGDNNIAHAAISKSGDVKYFPSTLTSKKLT